MPVPENAPPAGALDAAARLADRLRWFFLPLALCALVAVGVHTAADVVGELLLRLVDAADAIFDSLVSRWTLTAPLVDLVGPAQRIFFARGSRSSGSWPRTCCSPCPCSATTSARTR